ncbi:T6SS amidase immunity protein Tai4 family protein [Roseateles sp. L2-2]|uniref:T6SS amidase immunity protein Tai4 family protein n=1 Tax=Roseateles sp. L2-2 TaxID=3422597 RepID=UPI003D366EE0
MKPNALLVIVSMLLASGAALAGPVAQTRDSQQRVLKNWALAHCLAQSAPEGPGKQDAAASAAAYLEQGKQPIEAYEQLGALVTGALADPKSGSVPSSYNTKTCIDLFNSQQLDRAVKRLAK